MVRAGLRSLLFVPGDNAKLAAKALVSAADAVILDLEDAVVPDAKLKARDVVRETLDHADRGGKTVFVRINAFDTDLSNGDLASIAGGKPDGIVLPKCGGVHELERLAYCLDVLEAREGLEPGAICTLPVATETAAATLNLSIAHHRPPPRLWGAMWGSEDLAAALGANANRDGGGSYTFQYQYARSQCLYAASALDIVAVDAVYSDFRDLEGLEREILDGLRDGFTAKAAIHPAQVEVINNLLTPNPEQIDWARQVVSLLADAGVARLDGKMIDMAHKRMAERILQRASLLTEAA